MSWVYGCVRFLRQCGIIAETPGGLMLFYGTMGCIYWLDSWKFVCVCLCLCADVIRQKKCYRFCVGLTQMLSLLT